MPQLLTPLVDLLPPERFKEWGVLAPHLVTFFDDLLIVEWREDALGNPIQRLRLFVFVECCDNDTEFGPGPAFIIHLQTFVRKQNKSWVVRNLASAAQPNDSFKISNFVICDVPSPDPCHPPTSPGQIYFSDFEAQIDQWITQTSELLGSKMDFLPFQVDFLGCDPIDSTCGEGTDPGWYAQVFILGNDFLDPIFVIAPLGVPNEQDIAQQIWDSYQEEIMEAVTSGIEILKDLAYSVSPIVGGTVALVFEAIDLAVDIELIFCAPLDERCPEPGYYFEFVSDGGAIAGRIKTGDIPPGYFGEPTNNMKFVATTQAENAVTSEFISLYNLDENARYDLWDVYRFGYTYELEIYDENFDIIALHRAILYTCNRENECPEGESYDPIDEICVKSCPSGQKPVNGECEPVDDFPVDSFIIPVWVEYEFSPVSGMQHTFRTSVDPLGTVTCDYRNDTTFDTPGNSGTSDNYMWDPREENIPIVHQTQVFSTSFQGEANTKFDYSTCGLPMAGAYRRVTHSLIFDGATGLTVGFDIDFGMEEVAGEFNQIGNEGETFLESVMDTNLFKGVSFTIYAGGDVVYSYTTPGFTPPVIINPPTGSCKLCAQPVAVLSLELPIRVYRDLPDGTQRTLAEIPVSQELMRIPLPSFCVDAPPGLNPTLFNITSNVVEGALSMVVDYAVDAALTALFPGYGALIGKFVDVSIEVDWTYECP